MLLMTYESPKCTSPGSLPLSAGIFGFSTLTSQYPSMMMYLQHVWGVQLQGEPPMPCCRRPVVRARCRIYALHCSSLTCIRRSPLARRHPGQLEHAYVLQHRI